MTCAFTFVLFPLAEEEGEEEEDTPGDTALQYNKLIMPQVIISLDAGDDFLKDRVMNLPQAEVEGTHNTEEGMDKHIFCPMFK